MSDGFFERWSRRKVDAREGKAVEAEPEKAEGGAPPPQPSPRGGGSDEQQAFLPPPPGEGGGGGSTAPAPLPTLEDVKTLTTDSDFTRYLAPEVAPEVKNAALKKLFSDPHFNTMDGLDVYTGDYSKPDPIPEALMRKLASAQYLRLFEEKDKDKSSAARDVANDTGIQSVAQSSPIDHAVPEPSVHDDPDLRLQQDDAAQGAEPWRDPE